MGHHMNYAYWRKCDFQVHTPRDPNWKGQRPVGENDDIDGSPATMDDVNRERQKWANEFVRMCSVRGLEVIAVTDHHEMVMVPFIKRAISDRKLEDPDFDLWFLPGMEVTVACSV